MGSSNVRKDELPTGAGSGAADVRVTPAASTIVLRGDPFEILLMRKHERSSFVPGAWVFPGGAVEPEDHEIASRIANGDPALTAMKVCAVRELFEESGIWALGTGEKAMRADLLSGARTLAEMKLDVEAAIAPLVWTARWITPVGVPKRFDTWFFLLPVAAQTMATADETEGVETVWLTPAEALRRHESDEMPLVFPTIKNLEALTQFSSATRLLESRSHAEIRTTEPILIVDGKNRRIVLPDDPAGQA